MSEYGDDLSWPQGRTAGGGTFAIVGAVSGDSGRLFTQSTYVQQIAAVREAGREVGHYVFNGGDPTALAEYAWTVISVFMRENEPVFIDVETQSNRAPAWTPEQVLTFQKEFARLSGIRPTVYGSLSILQHGWENNQAFSNLVWVADYELETPPTIAGWKTVLWQYSGTSPLDLDYTPYTLTQIRAWQNAQGNTDPEQEDDMKPTIITDGKTGQLLYAFGQLFKFQRTADVETLIHVGIPVVKTEQVIFDRLVSITTHKF